MKLILDDLGVIVCEHIAKDQCDVCVASRSEPVAPEDSGWQFLCGKPDEDEFKAAIWSVKEILAYDSSLAPWIDAPFGTKIEKSSNALIWRKAA